MNADDEQLVAGWIAAALADLEAGKQVDLAQLCRERPEFAEEVAEALGLRHALAGLRERERDPASPAGSLLAARYRLLAPIGSGAAGTVWRAHDERLDREVAVKLLHRGLFDDADGERRFHREATALAAHEHAHIVRIHDQGRTDDGTTFLVTELLHGVSLQAVLAAAHAAMPDGPSMARFPHVEWLRALLPEAELEHNWLRQAVRWTAELGEALVAAHREGVCHRDVKPGNAFVRASGSAVLLDFGIAARAGDASITRTQMVLGTPCYMAPEQARGRVEPHPTLDVYGLAATLYHLVTLAPPHEGDLQQVMVSLRLEDPVPASRLCRGLPRDVQAVLDHGLERDPRRRYATMQDLVRDLRAFLDHAPVTARPLGRTARTWRRLARRPARSVAIGTTTLALVFGGIAVPAWLGLQAQAAENERAQRLARLPADLCIEGRPEQRALVPLDETRDVLADLDRLLELDGRDVAVRLMRASTLLDMGEVERAHRDFAALAALAKSSYVQALAERYANAAPAAGGVATIDLTNLPEPETQVDFFLAGFHALRAHDCERADEWLSAAEDYLPARDLRLLAILGRKKPDPQRAIREASWLEGVYGHATARTQHTLAAAHLQLREYAQAIPFCERAIALRPHRHGPWNNLGLAHLRLGHLDEALRCYRRAVDERPDFDNSLSGLCQTLRELGRHDEARTAAGRITDVGWREYELGNIDLTRALAALLEEDAEGQQKAAADAVVHFTNAAAEPASANPKAGSVRASQMLAQALAEGRPDRAMVPLLFGLRADPRNARQIANLSALLRVTEITDDVRDRLRLWLLDLAVDLAPEDPTYQRLRAALFDQLRAR
ncbi:MAG TPA: serine/threonine-protein kinase [Planctomycetota bacterium]|nr:serine/threonine-protein kinase [Planctomycetota bacterium]